MDSFFGIGLFELILIAVIALVVMGPERLPGAMREAAKYMRQLRQISGEFQSQFSEELQMLDDLNPKRILNDAINPPAPKQPLKQPTSKSIAQGGGATLPAAAAAPAAGSAEAGNSILPPKSAPTAAPTVAPQNGADAAETTVVAASPQDDSPTSSGEPTAAENGQ